MSSSAPDIISLHGARPSPAGANGLRLQWPLFLIVVALAPLWFGSNRPFAWNLNAVLLGGLMVWTTIEAALAPDRMRLAALAPVRIPVALYGLVALWILVQTLPGMPDDLVDTRWLLARDTLNPELPGHISIAPGMTAAALARYLTDGAAFWLAYQLCGGRDNSRALIATVAGSAAAYSLYGLISFAAGIDYVLWVPKVAYKPDLTASFFNRNSFATYAGIGAMAALEMVYRNWRDFRRPGALPRLAGWIAALVIIIAALTLTHSRAGLAVTAAGVLALTVLRIVALYRFGLMAWLTIAGAVIVSLCGLVIAYSFLGRRMLQVDDDFATRLDVYRLAWEGLMRQPFTGYGYGTFELFFPMVRDWSLLPYTSWDKAHNVYLEAAVGLGLPAAALLLLAIAWLVVKCVVSALTARRDSGAQRVAASVGLAVALHSTIDFSLQMQGISIVFFALLGAGTARAAPGES